MGWFNTEQVSDGTVQQAASGLPRAAPPSTASLPSNPKAPVAAGGSLPAEWFHRYFDTLWRLVARLGVAGHSIDDVVQETFIAASRRRADIREGQERRFLIGTAVRLSSNYRRRAHVRHEVSADERLELEPSALPDAETLLMEKHLRSLLDAALATLPDAQREVFVLYELEGFSTAEIGEMVGVPLGTVASRLARARSSFSKTAARSLQTELP
jgi:RNA polymerase sigma-70 factor (ECF subfamily)